MSVISVILPFKDAEATIVTAVNSILQQSFADLEVILIDDHSTDKSTGLVTQIKDSRIKLIANDGYGLVSALNTGLEKAQGPFIARMDADDLSFPKRLETQFNHLQALPENYVLSCRVNFTRRFSQDYDSRGYKHYVDWTNTLITPQQHFVNRFADATIAHPTLFCRKSVFDQYGIYKEGRHPEDFELWLRWMDQGVRFEKVKETLYEWTDHHERLSRTHPNYYNEKFSRLKAVYLTRIPGIEQKKLWVIGYGKDVFRKAAYLEKNKLNISGFVDTRKRPMAERKVITYNEIRQSSESLFLVYVSDRRGKRLIAEFLGKKGMEPGIDYLFMS